MISWAAIFAMYDLNFSSDLIRQYQQITIAAYRIPSHFLVRFFISLPNLRTFCGSCSAAMSFMAFLFPLA